MQLVLSAEWKSNGMEQELEIAGLSASVWDKGDFWAWEVVSGKGGADVAILMEDWAGNEAQAKKLAEEAIHDYFARKEQ